MINLSSISLTIANNTYGYGHLKRMLTLKRLLKKKKLKMKYFAYQIKILNYLLMLIKFYMEIKIF